MIPLRVGDVVNPDTYGPWENTQYGGCGGQGGGRGTGGPSGPVAPYWGPGHQGSLENPREGVQSPEISREAGEEPMLQVKLQDEVVNMMVDTGATYTCGSQQTKLPGKHAKMVGFSGQVQLILFMTLVTIAVDNSTVYMPILVSEHTYRNFRTMSRYFFPTL